MDTAYITQVISALHDYLPCAKALSHHFYHIFTRFCDKCVEISWRSSCSPST